MQRSVGLPARAKMTDLLKESDLTDIYIVVSIIGALLSVYWTAMMKDDPANNHAPRIYIFMRMFFITAMAMGMLTSVWFSLNSNWTPWVTETIVNISIVGFLWFSIQATRIRIKTCKECPFLPTTARHGWFRDVFSSVRRNCTIKGSHS